MTRELPEGAKVFYEEDVVLQTPQGRELLWPHHRTQAYVFFERPNVTLVSVGQAIAKEGPLWDRSERHVKFDRHDPAQGRRIALGRALKGLEALTS